MKKRALNEPQAYFFACLFPLLIADFVRILISYYGYISVDRGMWPMVLIFMVIVSFLYSALAYVLAHLSRDYNVAVALRHGVLLGAVLIVFTLVFYMDQPDWLAVNNGRLRLTPVETVIYNHWTPWAIYLFFYTMLCFRFAKLFHRR